MARERPRRRGGHALLARHGRHVRRRARDHGGGRVARRRTRHALSRDARRGGAPVGMSPALRADHVSFAYGATPALADVSFTLAPGERVALLGRNGAGKSTLVKLVTGLLRPRAGSVWVGDWDTRDRAPEALARRVGSVFQHADQQLFARALGLAPSEVHERVARALAVLGLEGLAREHPYDLPPAFRKLAALAGALALEPALLVLDEPTAGLDRALRARVAHALGERSTGGVALLVITHDLTFAAETLERGLVLDRGRLACDEPLRHLLAAGDRLAPLGLAPPPVAALSAALQLPGRPVRAADAARALARVAAGRVRP